ncbi:hypothetical protein ACFWCB_22595 [Streptomyces sp. NPDC060048]|uniref:hypothetical protein n=1 Tax=unclassified Streptomyces TaxID=2593676 RepID=UPI00368312C7
MPEAFAGSGRRRRTLLAAAALAPRAIAGCSAEGPTAASAHVPEPGSKDALVMVIQSAEKPYPGNTGEDAEGNEDPGPPAGLDRRRGDNLHHLVPPDGGWTRPRPAVLFATGGSAGPARCRQTVEPLTAALRTPLRDGLVWVFSRQQGRWSFREPRSTCCQGMPSTSSVVRCSPTARRVQENER